MKLRRSKLLGLIGATGSGKISFVRAGLAPAAPAGWGIVIATPGNRPFTQLAQELVTELAGDTEVMKRLVRFEEGDEGLSVISRWRGRHEEARVFALRALSEGPPAVEVASGYYGRKDPCLQPGRQKARRRGPLDPRRGLESGRVSDCVLARS